MSEYHVNVEPIPVAIKSGIAVPTQAVWLEAKGVDVNEFIVKFNVATESQPFELVVAKV
jgi:ribosomal protein L11